MTNSQNGWPVVDPPALRWFSAAGGRFAAGNDDAAYVARYLINRFAAEVEPIAGPVLDDWSYAKRNVRDSPTSISNHASATAWDLNAVKHGRGMHGTFKPAQVEAVRRILAAIVDNAGRKIFRWGNDYTSSPIDSMHFEINATPAQTRQARLRLEADTMELTDAQLAAIAHAVLTADEIPDKVDPENKAITPATSLRRLKDQTNTIIANQQKTDDALAQLAAAVNALAARIGPPA